MSLVLTRLRDALRVLRWSRRERKTALLGAASFAAIPVLRLLPFDAPNQKVATWAAIVLGSAFVVVTLLRLRRYSLAPPAPQAVPGVVAIKGAGAFTPEDAELFSRLGRIEELKQLRNGVLDVHKVSVVAVKGGVGGREDVPSPGRPEGELPEGRWEIGPALYL